MSSRTLERFTAVCAGAAFIAFVVSPIVVMRAVHESIPPALLVSLASTLLALTFAVQISFLLIQLAPESHRVVSLPLIGGDAWFTILIGTMMPALCWNDLVSMAAPSFSWLHFQFPLPLFQGLVFAMARLLQFRRVRIA
jgi:hypothetical protein